MTRLQMKCLPMFFLVAFAQARASICNLTLEDRADDMGVVVPRKIFYRNDKVISTELKKISNTKDKVLRFLSYSAPKSVQPLVDLNDQDQVLDVLIEMAKGNKPLIHSYGKDESSANHSLAMEDAARRMSAIELIGRFCDRRAGEFLIARIQDQTMPRDLRAHFFVALSNIDKDAEWKEDLREAFGNSTIVKIAESHPRTLQAWIQCMGKIGDKNQIDFVRSHENHADKYVRESAKKVRSELETKNSIQDK